MLPQSLHRGLLVLAGRVSELSHYVLRRPTAVCSIILQNASGKVLLVRHSYRQPDLWMLPSGRIGSDGDPVAAARREMREEISCVLGEANLIELQAQALWNDPRFETFIVGGSTNTVPKPDLREIDQACFFDLAQLPTPIDELTVVQLRRWQFRNSFPIPVPAFVRPEFLQSHYRCETETDSAG